MAPMINLKKIDLFKNLSDDDLKELGHYITTATYKKKDDIFTEGDAPEWFYIVLTGKVKVTKISHDGKEIILETHLPL